MGVAKAVEKKLRRRKGVVEVSETPGRKWGLLRSGGLGRLDKQVLKEDGAGTAVRAEQSFDFPAVMFAVDGSVPKFRSIAEYVKDDN